MDSVLEAFRIGGHSMYFVLLADLLVGPAALGALALAVAARVLGKEGKLARLLSLLMALLSALPAAAGGLGYWIGQIQLQRAVRVVAREDVAEFLTSGQEAARVPLHFGVASSIVVFGVAAVTFFVAPRRASWESRPELRID